MGERLFVLALVIGSAWLTWGLWNEKQTYQDLNSWPNVMADIVKLEDYEEEWKPEYGQKYKTYLIKLEYQYEVDGQTYTGSNLSASGDQMRWSSLDTMLADTNPYLFNNGTSVEIAHHPDKHAESIAIVCDRSFDSNVTHSWTYILISGGFCLFCLLMFVGSLMPAPSQQSESAYLASLRPNA